MPRGKYIAAKWHKLSFALMLTIPQPTASQTASTAIPATPTEEVAFINDVRAVRPATEMQQQIRALAAQLGLTISEVAVVLATSARTFARQLTAESAAGNALLSKGQVERLLLLQAVAAHGLDVFEDQDKFNRWLRRPLILLQNQSPLQVLDTVTGFRLVDQLLGRMEYGVYS